ncbi:conserved hypothetical protein [Treponema primitia ZAS-2]|uniref:Uncharacterized protein n=1 Tax=Treponema primitia (strain ATCC BAA-887 / DSM 12427 / ZAS-2) TaxID=545694 RepID=F5YQQ6_TREPZ|nr:PG0541 family transporter-associated protein [Treponema primitia]AEF86688.1 conserved hypothetical protein [Treponema primitia ZAS-2]
MIRIELIANHSVEENLFEAFAAENVGKFYTKIPAVNGVGKSGPKMGDAIWPEENFVLVIWCEEEEARTIERAVAKVKEQFPGEGVKLFGLRSGEPLREALPAPAPEAVPEPDGLEGLAGLVGME